MDEGSTSGNVGWHADPSDPATTRYWDGTRWMAERRWNGTAWVDAPIGGGPGAFEPAPQPTPAPTPQPSPHPTPGATPQPSPHPTPGATPPAASEPMPLPQPESFPGASPSPVGATGTGGSPFESGPSGSSGRSGLGSLDQRSKLILGAIVVAIVVAIAVVAFRGDDGGSGGGLHDKMADNIVAESHGEVTEEQADCIADDMIAAGFTQADYDEVQGSEYGMSVSSRLLDMFNDAVGECGVTAGG